MHQLCSFYGGPLVGILPVHMKDQRVEHAKFWFNEEGVSLKLNEARQARKSPIIVEVGDHGDKTTEGYLMWQEKSGKGYRIPTIIGLQRPLLETSSKIIIKNLGHDKKYCMKS